MSPSVDFEEYAPRQRQRLERLLTDQPRRGWPRLGHPPAGAEQAEPEADRLRSPELGDPEFQKNLRIFLRLVEQAEELHARAVRRGASGSGPQPEAPAWVGELQRRITFSPYLPVTLKLLLARRFELERLLIEVGDRKYLTGRLAEVYDEERGTHSTWRSLYGDQLPALLPGGTVAGPEPAELQEDSEVAATRRRLDRLMRVKESEDQVFRARWELKQRAATLAIVALLVVVAGFAAATAAMGTGDRELWAAAAAGAAGAALGGLIRLREQVTLGAQTRQFSRFFAGQLLVGVAAGILTFLVDQSGMVAIAGEGAGVAAVGFALGFSEAAFLGLLAKLGGTAAGG